MQPHDASHQTGLNHLIDHLADADGRRQHLKARTGIVQGQQGADQKDRQGGGVGHQGGESDRHGKENAVGNAQKREHQNLGPAQDHRQQHLTAEVAPERAVQGVEHNGSHLGRQPQGQALGRGFATDQQEHRQHQHDHGVEGEAEGGAQNHEQLLAELAGELAGAPQQVPRQVAEVGGPAPGGGPLLQVTQQHLPLRQPTRQGRHQLHQLIEQPRQHQQDRPTQEAAAHPQHHQQAQGPGQTPTGEPLAGNGQQKGQQGRCQEQGREGSQGQQQLPQHPEVQHQKGQRQAETDPDGEDQPLQHRYCLTATVPFLEQCSAWRRRSRAVSPSTGGPQSENTIGVSRSLQKSTTSSCDFDPSAKEAWMI